MSNEWYNIPRETKIRAYNQVAEATGVATFAVEKDWWVVQILSAIYEMEVGKFLIFKGGTSLSKAWNITIVKHRYIYTRIGGIDYNLHQPQTIDPIPILKFVTAWKADYKTMQEQMIYGDSPSFESMIDTIRSFIVNKINRLEWKMEVEFQS